MTEELSVVISELGLSLVGVVVLAGAALLMSCFVKIVTVLSMVRVGFGVGSVPGAFATTGVALLLTFFVMAPQLERSAQIIRDSLRTKGAAANEHDRAVALDSALGYWREFLEKHTEPSELQRFGELAKKLDASRAPGAASSEGAAQGVTSSWRVVAPAFLVSELRKGISTGLRVFLPFFVVELLTALALVALGAERLNPSVVSLPLKLLLFSLADGWGLITQGLVSTY